MGQTRRTKTAKPFVAPSRVWKQLEHEGETCNAKPGTFLFKRGESTKGVFVVLRGRVALSAGEDPTRVVRIAERGSLLGLPATVSGRAYSLTAEVVADSQLSMVSPSRFRRILESNADLGLTVVEMLAEELETVRHLAVYKY